MGENPDEANLARPHIDKGTRVSFVIRRSERTGNLEAHDVQLEKGNEHA